ncbi:MAG: ribonuclease P protein component [Bacteroidales bacterium]
MGNILPKQKKYGLSREERISNKKELNLLFRLGISFFIYPFHVFVVGTKPKKQHTIKVLVSASKKKVKKASQRNHLKRLMREAYRKNKHSLSNYYSQKHDTTLLIAIIYTDEKTLSAEKVEQKIQAIIQRLLSLHDKIPHFNMHQHNKTSPNEIRARNNTQ